MQNQVSQWLPNTVGTLNTTDLFTWKRFILCKLYLNFKISSFCFQVCILDTKDCSSSLQNYTEMTQKWENEGPQTVGGQQLAEGGRTLCGREAPPEGMKGKQSARNSDLQFTWGDRKCGQKVSPHRVGKSLNSRHLRPEQYCVVKPEVEVNWQTGKWEHWPWAGWVLVVPTSAWRGLTGLCGKGDAEISHGYEQWYL